MEFLYVQESPKLVGYWPHCFASVFIDVDCILTHEQKSEGNISGILMPNLINNPCILCSIFNTQHEDLIKALQELENSASQDAAVREKIANLPAEVQDVSLLEKIEGINLKQSP